MRHKKFARLARLIGNEVLARGHLELLWEVAYENGDDLVGDAGDLEHLAKWAGAPGALAAAMTEAGFVDLEGAQYRVHDLWDHAPDYVRKRRQRENERQEKGATLRRSASTDRTVTGQSPPDGGQRPPNGRPRAPAPAPSQEEAAAARASARDGAIPMTGPGVAEAAPPPPAAEAAPGPTPTSVPEAPLAAPDLAPETPSEGAGKACSDRQASTPPPQPVPADDDVPRRPLRLVDTSDLGPLGAEWRCDMERASGWKIVLAAVGRRDQVRKDLEAACEALGLERAVSEGLRVVERRKSQGLGPPGSWAFFLPALQDVIDGKELMPEPVRAGRFEPPVPGRKAPPGPALFTLERWQPLLAQLPPAGVEQLVAERDRLVAAIEGEGLWNSARNTKLFEVEEFLWTKWSGRAAAGGA
jgi:hypothetical protein